MDSLPPFVRDPFIHAIGWALIHSLWQGTLIALLLGLTLRYFRGASSQWRYLLSCTALFSVFTLTVATAIYMTDAKRDDARVAAVHINAEPVPRAVPVATTALPETSLSNAPKKPDTSMFAWVERCLPGIVLTWLAGLLLVSCRMLYGWGSLRRLRHQDSTPANEALQVRVTELCRVMGIGRAVVVLTSTRAAAPMVVGWVRPVILLPASCITGLSSQQLEAVLAHELAHILRHDYLVNLLQCVAETLLFYHPAVWWIGRAIRREREQCCDDRVVQITGDRADYARALLHLAETVPPYRTRLSLASQGGDLSGRVRRLLGCESYPPNGRWSAGLWAALASLCVAGLFVAGAMAEDDTGPNAAQSAEQTDSTRQDESSAPDQPAAPSHRTIEIPYQSLIDGDMRYNIVIRPGDVIRVSSDGGFVYLGGKVKRPGAYNIPGRSELTLKQLIVSAGGLDDAGAGYIDLVRRTSLDEEQTLHFVFADIMGGWSQDAFLAPNDVVMVKDEAPELGETAAQRRRLREKMKFLAQRLASLEEAHQNESSAFDNHQTVAKLSEYIESTAAELASVEAELTPPADAAPMKILPAPAPFNTVDAAPPTPEDLRPDFHSNDRHPVGLHPGCEVMITIPHKDDTTGDTRITKKLNDQLELGLPGTEPLSLTGLTLNEAESAVLRALHASTAYPDIDSVSLTVSGSSFTFIPQNPQDAATYVVPHSDYRLIEALAQAGGVSRNVKILHVIRYTNSEDR